MKNKYWIVENSYSAVGVMLYIQDWHDNFLDVELSDDTQ